jgi:hypothetical protein
MSKTVQFRERQEVTAADFNNAQAFAGETVENLIKDGISSGRHYVGLGVTQQATTTVRVAIGRMYQAGKLYTLPTLQDLALITALPLVQKRVVAVVGYGSEVDADVEQRDFLIDVQNNTTEAQAVPMTRTKLLNVDVVLGIEAATPVAPSIGQNQVLIALVTLTTTGIESIEQITGNVLPSVSANREDIRALQAYRARTEPQIGALTTTIAAVAEKTESKADLSSLIRVSADVARVKELLKLPATYAAYGADYFGDVSKTDTGLTGLTARVDNGLLFPRAEQADLPLSLQNPIDPNVTRSATDWLLPKYEAEAKLRTEGYSGDIALSQYQVQTHALKSYVTYEYAYHYGWSYNYWWDNWNWYYYYNYYGYSYWWNTASYLSYGYYTSYPVTHYKLDVSTANYSGVIIAQTFIAASDYWFTGAGIFLTQKDAAGDIRFVLCETEYGKPVLSKTLSQANVAIADVKGGRQETRCNMPPVLLESGKRYALALITTGGHRASVVSGNNFTQGTLFYGNDGDYFTGDITKDLEFAIYGAKFQQARTEVVLQPVSLAGGISDLMLKTQQVIPDGAELSYEVQIAGIWYPLSTVGKLATLPNLVPLRAVFIGTRDLQPGLQLGANRINVSRADVAMIHYSSLITLGASSADIRVQVRLAGFSASDHTATMKLVKPDTSEISPALVTTTDNADGSVTKEFRFTPSPAITQFRIKINGGRNSAAVKPFTVAERVHIAI